MILKYLTTESARPRIKHISSELFLLSRAELSGLL